MTIKSACPDRAAVEQTREFECSLRSAVSFWQPKSLSDHLSHEITRLRVHETLWGIHELSLVYEATRCIEAQDERRMPELLRALRECQR